MEEDLLLCDGEEVIAARVMGDGMIVTGMRDLQDIMRKLLNDPRKTNIVPVLVQKSENYEPLFHVYWREEDSNANNK